MGGGGRAADDDSVGGGIKGGGDGGGIALRLVEAGVGDEVTDEGEVGRDAIDADVCAAVAEAGGVPGGLGDEQLRGEMDDLDGVAIEEVGEGKDDAGAEYGEEEDDGDAGGEPAGTEAREEQEQELIAGDGEPAHAGVDEEGASVPAEDEHLGGDKDEEDGEANEEVAQGGPEPWPGVAEEE